MQYRTLGRTGLRVSEVGVGGAQFGIPDYMGKWDPFTDEAQATTTATIHRALDLGYTYFDTAPSYGDGRSEVMVGQALRGHRDEVTLATKISAQHWGSPEAIRTSVEESLRRLQVDVIDIIQLHGGWYSDGEPDVLLEQDGVAAMERLREEGKVRHLGFTCEAPSGGVERMIDSNKFDVMQARYSLMFQHPSDFENRLGIIRRADALGMGVVLMRPMTSGVFQRLMSATFPQISTLDVGRLLLNYVLSDPYVDVALIGMRDPRFVEINAEISDDTDSRIDLEALHYRFAR